MASVILPPLVGEQRYLISGVSYGLYKQFCEEIGEQPIRLSYCDETLEITITKAPHEYFKKLLGKLIEAMVLELGIPVRSGGMMTFQRDDLQKGFEPDDCWWIAHEAEVREKTEFDFHADPPPDLALEVEISHSLVSRIGIYAALGVPEVWRFDGTQLRFCVLGERGEYADADTSPAFPFLSPRDLMPFLAPPNQTDETSRVRAFVQWLRGRSVG
jgi:Uma2 family endonuclease